MSGEAKSVRANVPASVKRVERKRWEAWVTSAGSHGVTGTGATEAEARADLDRNLAWCAHHVGIARVFDGEGAVWVATAGPYAGAWVVRRAAALLDGYGGGSTIMSAPTFSAMRDEVAKWNKPAEAPAA